MNLKDSSLQIFNTSNSGIAGNDITCMKMDSSGKLFLGIYTHGLDIYDGHASWQHFNSGNCGIVDDNVNDICFDNHGGAWICTQGALDYWKDTIWTSFTYPESPVFTNNFTKAIMVQDSTWISSVNGGLYRYKNGHWKDYRIINSYLLDNTIMDIAADHAGNIWLATPYAGLARFDRNETWFYRQMINSSIASNSLNCLAISTHDVKYMGSNDAGLDRYDGGLYWVHYNHGNSPLPDNNVTNVEMRNETEVWIATNYGFAVLYDTLPTPHPSGIEQLPAVEVAIYPNPCSNKLYVHLNNDSRATTFQLSDMNGKVVIVHHCEGTEMEINVSQLSSGIYFYQLKQEEQIIGYGKLRIQQE